MRFWTALALLVATASAAVVTREEFRAQMVLARREMGLPEYSSNQLLLVDMLPEKFDEGQISPQFFETLEIPAAWSCSQACSAIFITGLSEERAIAEDVSIAALITDVFVNYDEKSVTCQMKGTGEWQVKAIVRDGIGCTLVQGMTEAEIRAQDLGDQTPLPPLNASEPWPLGDYVSPDLPPGVDLDCVEAVAENEFSTRLQNLRAILVVYKGQVVFERYDPDLNKDSRMIGWSMTKSVNAALVGQLIGEGRLELDQPAPVDEWQGPFDDRKNITIRHMLNMGTGLRYYELFVPWCLYTSDGNPSQWYAERRLVEEPGTFYRYSTGVSTLLARIVQENRGRRDLNNFEYMREMIYRRLNMHSALIEHSSVDAIHLGGSQMFATARDWARFGYLYMNGGNWFGDQIIPEGWADYSCELAPALPEMESGERYGAQWWVTPEGYTPEACYMDGFRNQNVFNIKAKDLIIVRLSMPGLVEQIGFDKLSFLKDMDSCFA